jgi:hypothetical protein
VASTSIRMPSAKHERGLVPKTCRPRDGACPPLAPARHTQEVEIARTRSCCADATTALETPMPTTRAISLPTEATAAPPPPGGGRSRRRRVWPLGVIAAWFVIAAALAGQAGQLGSVVESSATSYLPPGSASKQVTELTADFGDEAALTAVVVWTRTSGLTPADRVSIEEDARTLQSELGGALIRTGAVGPIPGHLRTMLDAGLLSRARSGRTVLYQRTPVGEALLSTTE